GPATVDAPSHDAGTADSSDADRATRESNAEPAPRSDPHASATRPFAAAREPLFDPVVRSTELPTLFNVPLAEPPTAGGDRRAAASPELSDSERARPAPAFSTPAATAPASEGPTFLTPASEGPRVPAQVSDGWVSPVSASGSPMVATSADAGP